MPSPSDSQQATPGLQQPGSLQVKGPHATADLVVLNHHREPVGRGVGDLGPLMLPAGLYDVQATLGNAKTYHMVLLEPGKSFAVKSSDWKQEELQFASAAPLTNTSTTREWQTEPAERWSSQPTWTPTGSGAGATSRLFIFVRTLYPEQYRDQFADGLEFLDCDGRLLTTLAGDSVVQSDKSAGWMAFCADLPAGPYLLRRNGRPPEVRTRCQPVYLCPQWATQIFIPSGRQPSLRRWTLMYTRNTGKEIGFIPNDEQDKTAEAILHGLQRGRNLATAEPLRQLLEHKLEKPWLGVLAAYAMRLPSTEPSPNSRAGHASKQVESSAARNDPLYKTLIERLHQMLGDHPDVRALRLSLSDDKTSAFPFPPLLQASLALVQQNETQLGRDMIPADSLTDCIMDQLYTNSAWTGWGLLPRTPRSLAEFTEQQRQSARPSDSGVTKSAGRDLSTVDFAPPDAVNADDPSADGGETGHGDSVEPAALKGAGATLIARSTIDSAPTQSTPDDPCVADMLASVGLQRAHLRPAYTSVSSILPHTSTLESQDRCGVVLAFVRAQQEATPRSTYPADPAQAVAVLMSDLTAQMLGESFGLPRARATAIMERLHGKPHEIAALLRQLLSSLTSEEHAVVEYVKHKLLKLAEPTLSWESLDDFLVQTTTVVRNLMSSVEAERWRLGVFWEIQTAQRQLARRARLSVVTDASGKNLLFESPAYAMLFGAWLPYQEALPPVWRDLPPGLSPAISTFLYENDNDSTSNASGIGEDQIAYSVRRVDFLDNQQSTIARLYRAEPSAPPFSSAGLSEMQRQTTGILTYLELIVSAADTSSKHRETYRRDILSGARRLRTLSLF